MNILDRVKVVAEVAELASRVYGVVVDKSRAAYDREKRIADLESKVAELVRKAEAK